MLIWPINNYLWNKLTSLHMVETRWPIKTVYRKQLYIMCMWQKCNKIQVIFICYDIIWLTLKAKTTFFDADGFYRCCFQGISRAFSCRSVTWTVRSVAFTSDIRRPEIPSDNARVCVSSVLTLAGFRTRWRKNSMATVGIVSGTHRGDK